MSHSEKIYQALKSEFSNQDGGLLLQNSQGVKLETVLETIGFTKTIETENSIGTNRTWETFRNPKVDFSISVRETSERKPNFNYTANISMNG